MDATAGTTGPAEGRPCPPVPSASKTENKSWGYKVEVRTRGQITTASPLLKVTNPEGKEFRASVTTCGNTTKPRSAWSRFFAGRQGKSLSPATIAKKLTKGVDFSRVSSSSRRRVQSEVRDAIVNIIKQALVPAKQAESRDEFQKVNLDIFGHKISVLFRTNESGEIVEANPKGKHIMSGTYKNSKILGDLFKNAKLALLSSLKTGSDYTKYDERKGGNKSQENIHALEADAEQDMVTDHTNQRTFEEAAKNEIDKSGFPIARRLIHWLSGTQRRTALIAERAQDAFEFLGKKDVTLKERMSCVKQLANVIAVMHKLGYSHYDIKPENVLITGRGKKIKLSITDFGTFKKRDIAKGDDVRGSPGYTNPNGSDKQQDVHACAATFYMLLIGQEMKSAHFYGDPRNPFEKDADFVIAMANATSTTNRKAEECRREQFYEKSKLVEQFSKVYGDKKAKELADALLAMVVLTEGGHPPTDSKMTVEQFRNLL